MQTISMCLNYNWVRFELQFNLFSFLSLSFSPCFFEWFLFVIGNFHSSFNVTQVKAASLDREHSKFLEIKWPRISIYTDLSTYTITLWQIIKYRWHLLPDDRCVTIAHAKHFNSIFSVIIKFNSQYIVDSHMFPFALMKKKKKQMKIF